MSSGREISCRSLRGAAWATIPGVGLFVFFYAIKLEKSSFYGYLIIFKWFLLLNDNETGPDYGEL